MKPKILIAGPFNSYSGYGNHARMIAKSFIKLKEKEWDIQLINNIWGSCTEGYLEDHADIYLSNYLVNQPLNQQPDGFILISVAHEMQKFGKHFNILISAISETNICSIETLEGCNRADLIIVPSKFNKDILENTKIEAIDNRNGQIKNISLNSKVEILHEGIDTNIFYKYENLKKEIDYKVYNDLFNIKENFLFLYTGAFIERKNVDGLVKCFINTFKNKTNQPALLLKTNGPSPTIIDKENILEKIRNIQNQFKNDKIPQIYLLHGEFKDKEINSIYNHPKVKCMVSFTRGESYGLPLAEFSLTGKPILTSNWSGHLDFLHKNNCVLINGKLEQISPESIMNGVLIKESSWFSIDDNEAKKYLKDIYENYDKYIKKSINQINYLKNNFSYEKMIEKLDRILQENIKPIPIFKTLNLPKLNENILKLPKLQLIENENK